MESGMEYKKGLWTLEEDKVLMEHVKVHGKGKWNRVPKMTGLKRCGKSCRLRWMNYLSPGVKRGDFSEEEEDLIIRLHNLLGNRWSLIAGRVPGRTDNQVKNYWNTHLSKKLGIKTVKRKTISNSQLHKMKTDENSNSHSATTITFDITNSNNTTSSRNKSDFDNKQKENTSNNIENLSWLCSDHINLFSPLFSDPILEFSQDYLFSDL